MAIPTQLKLLSKEEISRIYDRVLQFLSTKGVRVEHSQALKILDKAGVPVDYANQQVKFPRDIIEEALRTVPRTIKLSGSGKDRNEVVPHPEGLFYVWSSTGCRLQVEPATNAYRTVTSADMGEWGQLIEILDNIDHGAFLTPDDVPGETEDIHSMKILLENSSKHINVQPHSFESIPYLIELAQAVVDEPLKDRPVLHIFSGSVAPYLFKAMDVEIILQCASHGIPVEAQSLTCMGATTPVTIAGNLIVGNIEILAQLVMSQLFKPGTPVLSSSAGGSTLDMATGRSRSQGVESLLSAVAGIQFSKEIFRTPVYKSGLGSDSCVPDGQAMMDVALRGLLVTLAGNDVFGLAGRLYSAKAISYIQLILDDMLAGMLKRILKGVEVDEEQMAWQDILDTKPGGHFLETAHTLKHCRDALRLDLLITDQACEDWTPDAGKDLTARAVDRYQELKKTMKPLELSKEVRNELNRIVKQADKHLVK